MNRRFRLTRSTDFKRVRLSGKSYTHPLVVLISLPESGKAPRFGFAAGQSLGPAVKRNRAKRILREALRPYLGKISDGGDVILIARRPILQASFREVQVAILQLLQRAGLIIRQYDC